MATDNYKEILQEVCEKLNNLDSANQTDIINIKNSIESIENLITDSQSKLNFQDIKDKLENISLQVENCNEGILKDLFNDINSLKETTGNVSKYLDNIQNTQNLTLTSAEFEEFQKQQLDLALKNNENIYNELTAIKENILATPNGDNVKKLEEQLSSIHENLSDYIEKLVKKLPESPSLDEIGAIMSDLNSVHQKNIKQTNLLIKDLISKFSDFQNEFNNKEFENQFSKIGEIYDSLNIISVWVEKVGYINQAIDNVYNRLGDSIDFDEVSEKVDIIYENITALNNWSKKIDNLEENSSFIKSKINSLSDFQDTAKQITNALVEVKNKLDSVSLDNVDFDDFTNKIDLIYENIGLLNDWVVKIDNILQSSKDLDLKFQKISDNLSSNLKEINDNLVLGFNEINDNIKENIQDTKDILNIKLDKISQNIDANSSNTDKIAQNIPDIKNVLENLSNDLHSIISSDNSDNEASYIYNLMDIEADFLKLHKSLDENSKSTSNDINSIKECFNQLNEDISSISIRTNKLILSADDANKEFRTYLDAFKNLINSFEMKNSSSDTDEKYTTLCTKITEMLKLLNNSVNANNNLNTAFAYLAEWIDATGGVLTNIQEDLTEIKSSKNTNTDKQIPKIEFNNEFKEEILGLTEQFISLQDNLKSFKSEEILGLTEQFISLQDNLKSFKSEEILGLTEQFTLLQDNLNSFKSEEISELKSLLTGIMVQLNTALTPDIDSLNERIDKLCEENGNKLSSLEKLLQAKVLEQEQKINSLEEKIDNMSQKFDKLIEVMSDDSHNYEVKDILNYLASQINTNFVNIQNTNALVNEVANKLENFDTNITKIVSYIEEE